MKAKADKRPARPAAKGAKGQDGASEKSRLRRIAEERGANDPQYRPNEKDAQIDASGARFKSDA